MIIILLIIHTELSYSHVLSMPFFNLLRYSIWVI